MERKEFDDLLAAIVDRLDSRYKLREECDKEMDEVNERLANGSKEFAVINTKLSAILWILGVLGTGIIGFVIRYVFGG